jgi:hypothetical protein
MPMPLSRPDMTICSSSRRPLSRILPCSSVYFAAFIGRFEKTWARRTASAKILRFRTWLAVGCFVGLTAAASGAIGRPGGAPLTRRDGRDAPRYHPTPSFAVNERALLDH